MRKREAVAVSDRVGWTSFHAIATKNAARIVNIVDARVALAGRNSLRIGVFRGLDVDTSRGTRRGTEETAHAFLEAVFVAVKDVNATIPWLKMDRLFRVVFRNRLAEHVAKCHAETFDERYERFAGFFDDRWHRISV